LLAIAMKNIVDKNCRKSYALSGLRNCVLP